MLSRGFMQLDGVCLRDGVTDFQSEAVFHDLQVQHSLGQAQFFDFTSIAMETQRPWAAYDLCSKAGEPNSPLAMSLDMRSDLGLLPDFNLDDINNVQAVEEFTDGQTACISIEKAETQDPNSAESKVELSERIRLNYHQKPIVQTIKDVYRSKLGSFGYSFEEAYKHSRDNFLREITRQQGSRKKGSKSLSAITEKRCNETKYTRSLLRCFVAAASEMLSFPDSSAMELYRDLETCTRVQQIHAFIVKSTRQWFIAFLKEFLIPGHMMISVIERLNNKPAISVLLLEAVLVLQRMVLEPWRKFNTWKIQKLQIKGTYDEALQRLRDGTATLDYVKTYAEQEFKKCISKFKNRKCSDKNNITHFWVNMVLQMFSEIHIVVKEEALSAKPSDQRKYSELEFLIKKGTQLLAANESEQSLLAAIEDTRIGEIVTRMFIKTNRLLAMILQIDSTNAMMIHNLVSRYEWFIGLFKK